MRRTVHILITVLFGGVVAGESPPTTPPTHQVVVGPTTVVRPILIIVADLDVDGNGAVDLNDRTCLLREDQLSTAFLRRFEDNIRALGNKGGNLANAALPKGTFRRLAESLIVGFTNKSRNFIVLSHWAGSDDVGFLEFDEDPTGTIFHLRNGRWVRPEQPEDTSPVVTMSTGHGV